MIRTLMAACAVLVALCVIQWTTLTRLRRELESADRRAFRAALVELKDRRDEFSRALTWLDTYMRDERRRGDSGLCPGGAPDTGAIADLVFDVYLRERATGASEAEARQRVVDALQQRAGPAERRP